MKKYVTGLLFAFTMCNVNGQNKNFDIGNLPVFTWQKIKPQDTFKPQQQIDFVWDKSDWSQRDSIHYGYNADGNIREKMSYYATSKTQTIYTYDTKSNLVTKLNLSWDNGWLNNSKEIYSYDTGNNLTAKLYYTWESDSSGWFNSSKDEYIYDNNENLVEHTSQYLDDASSEMITGYKENYTYNGKNELLTITAQQRHIVSNSLVNDARNDFTYGDNGQITEFMSYVWDHDDWLKSYNAKNIVWHKWNGKISNELGLLKSFRSYTWDGATWQNYERVSNTYDGYDNQTCNLYEEWEGTAYDTSSNTSTTAYLYDLDNNLTQKVTQSWYESSRSFVNSGKTVYSDFFIATGISEINNNLNCFSVYPNPVYSSINVLFAEEQKNSILKLINLLGKTERMISNVNGRQIIIDREDLKAGVYFVQLISVNNSLTNSRIIIQ